MEASINNTNLSYEILGSEASEDTIVFLNGVMASYSSWRGFIPAISSLDCRILLHDFRGQLLSPAADGPWDFHQHALDLEALMDYLDIPSAHLVGTSYGGEVAMDFAASRPERTKSITVIDSVCEIDDHLLACVKSWIQAAEDHRGEPFFNLVLPYLYSRGFINGNQEMLASRASAMNRLPESYYLGQQYLYQAFLTLELKDSLPRTACPAMVICGTEDILKPPRFSEQIARLIPKSEYVLLPDCGHVAIFEKQEEITSLLLGFLVKQGLRQST